MSARLDPDGSGTALSEAIAWAVSDRSGFWTTRAAIGPLAAGRRHAGRAGIPDLRRSLESDERRSARRC